MNSKLIKDLLEKLSPSDRRKTALTMGIAGIIGDKMNEKKITIRQMSWLLGCSQTKITEFLSGTYDFTISDIAKFEILLETEIIKTIEINKN